jgi:hypothetical protein
MKLKVRIYIYNDKINLIFNIIDQTNDVIDTVQDKVEETVNVTSEFKTDALATANDVQETTQNVQGKLSMIKNYSNEIFYRKSC